jgi:hypothetical protein
VVPDFRRAWAKFLDTRRAWYFAFIELRLVKKLRVQIGLNPKAKCVPNKSGRSPRRHAALVIPTLALSLRFEHLRSYEANAGRKSMAARAVAARFLRRI